MRTLYVKNGYIFHNSRLMKCKIVYPLVAVVNVWMRVMNACWNVRYIYFTVIPCVCCLCLQTTRQISLFEKFIIKVILAWPGLAWPGLAWPGLAWPGLAWPGLAWPGLAWPGLAWPGLAWPGLLVYWPTHLVESNSQVNIFL